MKLSIHSYERIIHIFNTICRYIDLHAENDNEKCVKETSIPLIVLMFHKSLITLTTDELNITTFLGKKNSI